MKTNTRQLLLLLALFLHALAHAQNIGIGTSNPAARLHIIPDGSGLGLLQTSGTNTRLEFIAKADQVGIRTGITSGNGSYPLILGTEAGGNAITISHFSNVGIGNFGPGNLPTAKLDIIGTLRYRGSSFPNLPEPGAVLTSVNDNGDAEWQRPVVFKTRGLPAAQNVPHQTWAKVVFKNNDMELNEGLYFDPFTSTFNAPVKGAYYFSAQALVTAETDDVTLRIVVQRNGSTVKVFDCKHTVSDAVDDNTTDARRIFIYSKYHTLNINTHVYLEKNDKVWLEVRHDFFVNTTLTVNPNYNYTWFSGHLVSRL